LIPQFFILHKAVTCSTEGTFPFPFFVMFHVVFILLLPFAVSQPCCCFLASFITFLKILQYLIRSVLLLIAAVLRKGKHTSFVFARYFYSLCNPIVPIFPLYFTGKLAWKMFKKVHINELNIWLGSVSI
jgi:hypothetical protein